MVSKWDDWSDFGVLKWEKRIIVELNKEIMYWKGILITDTMVNMSLNLGLCSNINFKVLIIVNNVLNYNLHIHLK